MRDNTNAVRLQILSDMQAYIGSQLQRVYDSSRNGDYLLCDEVGKAIENADKFTLSLRVLAQIAERGMPKAFDKQEALLLEQLIKSKEFIEQRNIDREIGYLEDDAS